MSSSPTVTKPFKNRRWWKVVLGIVILFALVRACAGGETTATNTAPLVSIPTTTTATPRTSTTSPRPTTTPRRATTTTPAPVEEYDEPDVYVDPDPDVDVDVDPPKRRTGDSGHPCLPGERDGDSDGYCGE